MNIGNLRVMVHKETAALDVWNSMNSLERAAYIEAYPNSRFATTSGIIDSIGRGVKKVGSVVKRAFAPKNDIPPPRSKGVTPPLRHRDSILHEGTHRALTKHGMKKTNSYSDARAHAREYTAKTPANNKSLQKHLQHLGYTVHKSNSEYTHYKHPLGHEILHDHASGHVTHYALNTPRSPSTASINIKHPGALHEDLGIPQGEKIPAKRLTEALHSDDPLLRKRAQFARNAKKFKH